MTTAKKQPRRRPVKPVSALKPVQEPPTPDQFYQEIMERPDLRAALEKLAKL